MLKSLLQINPVERISSLKALQHQWFKENLTNDEYDRIINKTTYFFFYKTLISHSLLIDEIDFNQTFS